MFPTKPFFSEGQTLCQRRSEDRVGRAEFTRCWSHRRGRVPQFCTPLVSRSGLSAGVCVRQDSSKLLSFLTSSNLPRLRSEIWGSRGRRFKSCQPDTGVSRFLGCRSCPGKGSRGLRLPGESRGGAGLSDAVRVSYGSGVRAKNSLPRHRDISNWNRIIGDGGQGYNSSPNTEPP